MSEKNVEIARRFYPSGVDFAAVFANSEALSALRVEVEPLLDPDVEIVADPGWQRVLGDPGGVAGPGGLPLRGRDGFFGNFVAWFRDWEAWIVTPVDFIEVDDRRIVVVLDISARSKEQQVEMTTRGGNILTFTGGRIVRNEMFLRHTEALEAAGLQK